MGISGAGFFMLVHKNLTYVAAGVDIVSFLLIKGDDNKIRTVEDDFSVNVDDVKENYSTEMKNLR